MSNTSADPFTRTYEELWRVLTDHQGVSDLVNIGNQIKFLSDFRMRPEKKRALDADLPELMLVPTDCDVDLFATSSSTHALQSFELRLSTSDMRLDNLFFPLKWQIMIALSRCRTLNLSFVKEIKLGSFVETVDDDDANRGMPGWSACIVISVELWFPHTLVPGSNIRALQEV